MTSLRDVVFKGHSVIEGRVGFTERHSDFID